MQQKENVSNEYMHKTTHNCWGLGGEVGWGGGEYAVQPYSIGHRHAIYDRLWVASWTGIDLLHNQSWALIQSATR